MPKHLKLLLFCLLSLADGQWSVICNHQLFMAQKQGGFVDFEVREYQVSTSVPHLANEQQKSLSLLPAFRLKPAPFFSCSKVLSRV